VVAIRGVGFRDIIGGLKDPVVPLSATPTLRREHHLHLSSSRGDWPHQQPRLYRNLRSTALNHLRSHCYLLPACTLESLVFRPQTDEDNYDFNNNELEENSNDIQCLEYLHKSLKERQPGEVVDLPCPPTFVLVRLDNQQIVPVPFSRNPVERLMVDGSHTQFVPFAVELGFSITYDKLQVELGFSITYDKLQGKTLSHVILNLNDDLHLKPRLSYEDLHVGSSRTQFGSGLRILPWRSSPTQLEKLKPDPDFAVYLDFVLTKKTSRRVQSHYLKDKKKISKGLKRSTKSVTKTTNTDGADLKNAAKRSKKQVSNDVSKSSTNDSMSVRYIDEGDFRQLRPFDDHFLPQIPPSVLESVLLERNIQDNHRRKRLPFRLLGCSFDVQDTRADGLCLFYSLNVLTGMDVRSSIIEAFRNLPEHLRNTIMGYVSWRYSSLDLYIAHLNAPLELRRNLHGLPKWTCLSSQQFFECDSIAYVQPSRNSGSMPSI